MKASHPCQWEPVNPHKVTGQGPFSIFCLKSHWTRVQPVKVITCPRGTVKPIVQVAPNLNEDVVGAAPTGDAPTTSEWSTILLHTKVRLILECYGSWQNKRWDSLIGPGRSAILKHIVTIVISINIFKISIEISQITRSECWFNSGLGNGLVPWGNEPLPKLLLTKFFDAKWHHWEPMSLLHC